MHTKLHLLPVLLIFLTIFPAIAQTDSLSGSFEKTYRKTNRTLNYSYDNDKQVHNYSNNWDLDNDGINDEVFFIGTGGAHLYYFLRVVLSSDKKVRDFTHLQSDFPILSSDEESGRADFDPKNNLTQFAVLDKDNRKAVFIRLDNSSFLTNEKYLKRNGVKTNLILLTFSNGKAICKDLERPARASKSKELKVSYDRNKKYTVEELHFDLAILKDALVKAHPGLFWYQTEKEFEDNYNKVKNSISSPMTEMDFFTLVTPFVGNIKCGHTDLAMSVAFDNYFENGLALFPFNVRIIESKIYIEANYTADTTVRVGSEISSVNKISADSILRWMGPHQWTDGFTQSYTRMEDNFQLLLLSLFDYPDNYALDIIEPMGNARLIEVEALDYKTMKGYYLKRYAPDRHAKDQAFKFHEIDSLSTAIIKIDGFEGRGFEKFLENSFKTLKEKGTRNLIIDLRGNSGGTGYYANILYSYIALNEYKYYTHLETVIDNPKDSIFRYGKMEDNIWKYKPKETEKGKYDLTGLPQKVMSKKPYKPHADNFTGNVFVLIDVKSYSTSAEFSAVAHYNKRARFIGRETAGGYCGNTSMSDFILTLPKTGIQIAIPLVKGYMAVEGPCGGGIKPDYPLKEDINDYILHKDSDLLFTLDLINRSK